MLSLNSMALEVYLKSPVVYFFPPKKQEVIYLSVKKRAVFKMVAMLMVFVGISLLGVVATPLVYYQFIYGPKLAKAKILKPVSAIAAEQQTQVLGAETDYTKATNWFPTAKQNSSVISQVSSYNISIPDLGIKDAVVKIGADDLNRSLIHYGGTGLPGEYGSAVIFGHSILPVFYDPTSYRAIFSTLPTLKEGAKITVNYDGVEYTYEVIDKYITEPTDVSVLEQRYDNSYLILVTCYPPGTYYKRIAVRARLVRPN